jgi:phosphoadenosine phosphosulfate reductase
MLTGVRADESISRSKYDELSIGNKINKQISFHPLLYWSSAEIYDYIYSKDLPLNEAYKKGFNRVGCIICPNSSEKHEFLKNAFFSQQVKIYTNIIINSSSKDLSGNNAKKFLENGGWKTRLSGRELTKKTEFCDFEVKNNKLFCYLQKAPNNWTEWYKTIGQLIKVNEKLYHLEYEKKKYELQIKTNDKVKYCLEIDFEKIGKKEIKFISLFKAIIIKSIYCIECGLCEVQCKCGNLKLLNGKVFISDKCNKCKACLNVPSGCIYFNSIKNVSNGGRKMKGINRYLSLGFNSEWLANFLNDNKYEPGNRKTNVMRTFLNDSGIIKNKNLTSFGNLISLMKTKQNLTWALIFVNLAYSPQFKWYLENIGIGEKIEKAEFYYKLGESIKEKAKYEMWSAFKIIFIKTPLGNELNIGKCDYITKVISNGEKRITLNSITRKQWTNPDPRVILYALYKFAEACNNYYQFTLSRLMNFEIDSDGMSPAKIFGLNWETMETILNGLAVNYSDFISVAFTHDLDNITLKSDKTFEDVLSLFEVK